MKKLWQILSMGLVGAVAWAGVASAATTVTSVTCTIYQTGSSSYNSCVNNSSQDIQATCVNNIYVINSNAQNAGTGGANSSGNTSAGGAVTGTAVNENNVQVTLGASCGPATTTSTTPTPPAETPTTPTAAAPVVAPAQKVAVLPKTGESNVVGTIAVAAAALVGAVALARLGVAAYRRAS